MSLDIALCNATTSSCGTCACPSSGYGMVEGSSVRTLWSTRGLILAKEDPDVRYQGEP